MQKKDLVEIHWSEKRSCSQPTFDDDILLQIDDDLAVNHVSLEVAASGAGEDDVEGRYDGYHGQEEQEAEGDVQLMVGVGVDEVKGVGEEEGRRRKRRPTGVALRRIMTTSTMLL